jgi:hypothetical protein
MSTQIVKIEGSSSVQQGGNTQQSSANNLLDANPLTNYSAKGIGSYIDIHVKEEVEINTINVSFPKGTEKITKFTISTTKDFKEFEPTQPCVFTSNGSDAGPQKFRIKNALVKGVRISFDGAVPSKLLKSLRPEQAITTNVAVQQELQTFSISSVSIGNEELTETEVKELDERVEEYSSCDSNSKHECSCCFCNSNEIKSGVCTKCGRNTHHSVIEAFPLQYNHDTKNLSFAAPGKRADNQREYNQQENLQSRNLDHKVSNEKKLKEKFANELDAQDNDNKSFIASKSGNNLEVKSQASGKAEGQLVDRRSQQQQQQAEEPVPSNPGKDIQSGHRDNSTDNKETGVTSTSGNNSAANSLKAPGSASASAAADKSSTVIVSPFGDQGNKTWQEDKNTGKRIEDIKNDSEVTLSNSSNNKNKNTSKKNK